jgi:hypothetical protein
MAKSDKSRFEGRLVTIPTEAGIGLAKVLFCPAREKNAALFKIFEKVLPRDASITEADFGGPYELRYARLQALKLESWSIFYDQGVDADEHELTHRTSGGDVWIGDEHIGPATEADERSLPKMLIYGEGLIEKFVSGLAARAGSN